MTKKTEPLVKKLSFLKSLKPEFGLGFRYKSLMLLNFSLPALQRKLKVSDRNSLDQGPDFLRAQGASALEISSLLPSAGAIVYIGIRVLNTRNMKPEARNTSNKLTPCPYRQKRHRSFRRPSQMQTPSCPKNPELQNRTPKLRNWIPNTRYLKAESRKPKSGACVHQVPKRWHQQRLSLQTERFLA